MNKYISHKTVHAEPMTNHEYTSRYLDNCKEVAMGKPHTKAEELKGYLVIYNKDTPRHYESWSPEVEFTEGYTLLV